MAKKRTTKRQRSPAGVAANNAAAALNRTTRQRTAYGRALLIAKSLRANWETLHEHDQEALLHFINTGQRPA